MKMKFTKGQTVQTWFDTGSGKNAGPQILYGVVINSGPKMATIRWESGLRNRVRHCDHRVTAVRVG